jgi:beta-N-acetylhexosaminidase
VVDLDDIQSVVNAPESNAVAQLFCDRAVTLVRNENGMLPLKSSAAPGSTAFFLLAESRSGVEGQAFTSELRKHAPGAAVIQLDSTMSAADLEAAQLRAASAAQYVVAAFASVAAYRGTAALGGEFPRFVQNLLATKKPVALIALGNPYLLRNFSGVAAYMTTYSSVPPSEISAVKALFGQIPIGGKLPVTIPGLAKYGDGIQLH